MKLSWLTALLLAYILLFLSSFLTAQTSNTWTRTYGIGGWEEGIKVRHHSNGAIGILACAFGGPFELERGWLLHLNSEGDTLWTRVLGENFTGRFAFDQTSDSGYFVGWNKGTTLNFRKIKSNGQVEWSVNFNSNQTWLEEVREGNDGTLVYLSCPDNDHFQLTSIAEPGTIVWGKSYSILANYIHRPVTFSVTEDGSFVVLVDLYRFSNDRFTGLARIDANGEMKWTSVIPEGAGEWSSAISSVSDGYLIVSTDKSDSSAAVGVTTDVIKTDLNGQVIWKKSPRVLSKTTTIRDIFEIDTGYLLAGEGSDSTTRDGDVDIFLAATDSDLEPLWYQLLGGNRFDSAKQMAAADDGGYLIVGHSNTIKDGRDVLVIRTNSEGGTVSSINFSGQPIIGSLELLPNFPNPFNPVTTIRYSIPKASTVTLDIFDVNGRTVARLIEKRQSAGHYAVNWDGRDLSSGIYVYQLRTEYGFARRKAVLVK